MENKYYTPEIEEFYVGFEFEAFVNKKWIDTKIYDWYDGMEGEYRVKYLDKEDIQSLGFMYDSAYDRFVSKKESVIIGTNVVLSNNEYNQWVEMKAFYTYGEEILFQGKIKNKSELKRVLEQIGY